MADVSPEALDATAGPQAGELLDTFVFRDVAYAGGVVSASLVGPYRNRMVVSQKKKPKKTYVSIDVRGA
jgi:hypothetical protein